MWPSLETASKVANVANLLFIGSLVVGVISTIVIVWMSNVKEEHWSDLRRRSDERIAELSTETAAANARAKEAELALAKFKAPRHLSPEQQAELVQKMSAWSVIPKSGLPQSVAVFAISTAFEANAFADQLATTLGPQGAKWSVNRNHVMYGKSFTLRGVGLLISSNKRAEEISEALVKALNKADIFAFVVPERRLGCEDIPSLIDRIDTDPACSAISVIVGDKPS